MYVRAGRPALARPYVGVYRSTSLMSSSLLLQQCPTCLVGLTWIVNILLTCKQTIQIATFNVRTLNRIGQLPELTASAVEHKIDIIYIQAHRYTHTEDIKYHDSGNGWTLTTVSAWKNSINAAVGGVGMLIGPRALKTLNSIERIKPRMITVTFNGNPRATILSCYSPTNVSEETELVAFYDELSSLVRSIPRGHYIKC